MKEKESKQENTFLLKPVSRSSLNMAVLAAGNFLTKKGKANKPTNKKPEMNN